ncbi:MAG: amino acid ABC transporter permease [Nocardioidaceae bacterium]
MSSVLFDVPGPKTRARYRAVAVVSTLVLAGLIGWVLWILYQNDQFTQTKWQPLTDAAVLVNLAQGLLLTLRAAAVAILLAMLFGAVFAAGRLSDRRWLSWPSAIIVEFFRAVPLILLILTIFLLAGGTFSRYWCLVLGLMLYNGAVLAEIFRAGVAAVPRGQSEAAYAVGMRKGQVMRSILAPQAVSAMLPAIISQCVVVLKDTTLGIIISTEDVINTARLIYNDFRYNNAIIVGLMLAVVFIVINYSLSKLAQYVEGRLGQRGERVVDHTRIGTA